MGPQQNLTEPERLALWARSRYDDLLPSTVYLSLCGVIGVLGNLMVIFIYGLRLHKKHDGRYFIVYLAVADLLAVFFSVENHIVLNIYPVTYGSNQLCKFNCMLAFVATVFSSCVILIISVQRYLKVCKPFEGQMTLSWRRFSILLSCIFSIVFSIPNYSIYGLGKVHNQALNVSGSSCARVTNRNQTLFLTYSALCTLLVITVWLVLVVLYVKIARVIFLQSNTGDHESRTHKTSLMFMTISVIYIVTFLPRMLTSIIAGVNADFWETLSVEAFNAVYILHLLYIVNHLANPFVYAFMDVKLWTEFKNIFSCRTDKVDTSNSPQTLSL